MSLYVVKNDKGEWLYSDEYTDWVDQLSLASFYDTFEDADDDIECWELSNAYVVELVDAPVKVVVSEEEAKMLDQAKCDDDPAELIVGFVNSRDNYDDDRKAEDRLMRAYVNGYTVAKEKKYNVKVPYANYKWYLKTPDGKLDTIWVKGLAKGFGGYPDGIELTNDDIENFGLQDCEKKEVTDDD